MIDSRPSDRFVAVATHGDGMYSGFVNSIPAAPASPSLISPANNTGGVLQSQILKWDEVDGAIFYGVEISKDPDFNSVALVFDGLKENSVEINMIEQGRKVLYWRVAAKNSGGISNYSEIWSFMTAPAPPDITYPPKAADSIPINLTFKWEPADGANLYHIQLADRIFFDNMIIDTLIPETELYYAGLLYNKKYHWRISAIDEYVEGIFSERSSFNTMKAVSVSEHNISQRNFTIRTIYPNPAHYNINIEIISYQTGKVRIDMYDAKGNFVKNIADRYFPPGIYSINTDISAIPRGAYYCRISGTDYTQAAVFIKTE
jgi:hypothetical protein